jgi:hypothetical protein
MLKLLWSLLTNYKSFFIHQGHNLGYSVWIPLMPSQSLSFVCLAFPTERDCKVPFGFFWGSALAILPKKDPWRVVGLTWALCLMAKSLFEPLRSLGTKGIYY